jgi:hypothetical protein
VYQIYRSYKDSGGVLDKVSYGPMASGVCFKKKIGCA